jgi:hypothetical protein
MKIDSARDVKLQAREYLDKVFGDHLFRQRLGIRSGRRTRVQHPRSVAFGISRGESGEHQLAIRVQHPSLMDSKEIDAITQMAGGEVDLKFIGRVHKLQGGPWYQTQCRPIRLGCSVAHFRVTVGTLGALVRSTGQNSMLLSNNHVLADENRAKTGDAILQPASFENGQDPTDRIATFTSCVKLKFPGPNTLDCAVAVIEPGIQFDPTNIDQIGQLSGVRQNPLAQGDAVEKLGQTTGKTSGTVSAVEMDNIVIGYDSGDAIFDNQIEIQSSDNSSFSQSGDSGSLIVDSNCEATGLLFADNDQGQSYANPIQSVLDALSIQLLH